jgi:esterase
LPQEKVDATVLFLTGGKSHYVPWSDHESIREMAPHASFLSMENAGHWLHADQPEPFMQHCLDFFMS